MGNSVSGADSSASAWAAAALAEAEASAQAESDRAAQTQSQTTPSQTDGVEPPSASEQAAQDSFWAHDPNRPSPASSSGAPASTSSGASGAPSPGGNESPTPVALSPSEVTALQNSGLSVTPVGSGNYLINAPMETVSVTSTPTPPSSSAIHWLPGSSGGSSDTPLVSHHPEMPPAAEPISTTEQLPTTVEAAQAKRDAAAAQQRIAEAERLREQAKDGILLPGKVPPGADVVEGMRMAKEHQGDWAWFYAQVKTGGPWDFKAGGTHPEFEDFGNFHFGAVGRAFGIPEEILKRGAGAYQEFRTETSHPDWGSVTTNNKSYGDDPVDAFWIEQGSRVYEARP